MGDGGRSALPHLCSDLLSPSPAVLAGTHADIDLVPWPLSHQPAGLAAGLAVHKDLGRRSRMRGDAHSTLESWDWLGVASMQVRAKASSPSRRGGGFSLFLGRPASSPAKRGASGRGCPGVVSAKLPPGPLSPPCSYHPARGFADAAPWATPTSPSHPDTPVTLTVLGVPHPPPHPSSPHRGP